MIQTQPNNKPHLVSDTEFRTRVAEMNRENAKRGNGHSANYERPVPQAKETRVKLVPFDEIKLGAESRYLVKGIIPREGLIVA